MTTPLGIAIGIALHSAWSENDATGLAVQGVFDAMSCGILIYTAVSEFLAGAIVRSDEFGSQPVVRQIIQFGMFLVI